MKYTTDVCDRCKKEFPEYPKALTTVSLMIGETTRNQYHSSGVHEPFRRELCKECCRELGFARTLEEFLSRKKEESETKHLTTIELMDEAIRNYVQEIVSEQTGQ